MVWCVFDNCYVKFYAISVIRWTRSIAMIENVCVCVAIVRHIYTVLDIQTVFGTYIEYKCHILAKFPLSTLTHSPYLMLFWISAELSTTPS
jgi:hypothetical protein